MARSGQEVGAGPACAGDSVFVAMLRGVNVSGRNRLPMEQLRELALDLGHQQVRTYIQSGNLVFRSSHRDPDDVARGLKAAISSRFALDVAVLVRTREEIGDTVAANPLVDAGPPEGSLHVTFLASVPEPGRVVALDPRAGLPDQYRLMGRAVYLRCAGGYGRTKLNNGFFERRLGVAATTRNWASVRLLLEMAAGVEKP